MNNSGSIYFSVLLFILVSSLLVIGTSVSIHQVNQKKVWKSTKAWEAYWLGKRLMDTWKMRGSFDQEGLDGFEVLKEEFLLQEGILASKVNISWRDGERSYGISLSAYKPVLP
jgi:hypothetical protein